MKAFSLELLAFIVGNLCLICSTMCMEGHRTSPELFLTDDKTTDLPNILWFDEKIQKKILSPSGLWLYCSLSYKPKFAKAPINNKLSYFGDTYAEVIDDNKTVAYESPVEIGWYWPDTPENKCRLGFSFKFPVDCICLHKKSLAVGIDCYAYIFNINKKSDDYFLDQTDFFKHKKAITSVALNEKLLAISSLHISEIFDRDTHQKVSIINHVDPVLMLEWRDKELRAKLSDGSKRTFESHDCYTLDQLKLKWAINDWMLIEKPDRALVKKTHLSFIEVLFNEMATVFIFDPKEAMLIWRSFPPNMQHALRQTIQYKILKYGKYMPLALIDLEDFPPNVRQEKKEHCIAQ